MIICAALLVKHESFDGGNLIIPCHRHHNGYYILHELNNTVLSEAKRNRNIEHGFMTDEGDFLNREEAYNHALKCGQLSASNRQFKRQRNEDGLFSEDLY